MKIGLIDVDGHNFPNLCQMKISAFHKARGDTVEWCNLLSRYDIVYKSRVFDDIYTTDDMTVINAEFVISGGTGYDLNNKLPPYIECQCPDYSIYPQFAEAYGFLTRGCPRNCPFCIVGQKEGLISRQAGELTDFHRNQRTIKLLDPNLLACKDHESLLKQLANSGAYVDFTQGLDARLLNRDNIALLQKVKKQMVHFAWDREKDSDLVLSRLRMYKELTKVDKRKCVVYVLTNYDTDFQFDLYRVNTLRRIELHPYVMIYDKGNFVDTKTKRLKPMRELRQRYTLEQIENFKKCWDLQRWVNNRIIWSACERFEDFDEKKVKYFELKGV